MRAALTLALLLPALAEARGPIRVDLTEGERVICRNADGTPDRYICPESYVLHTMGVGFTWFPPPEGRDWGLLRIRAPSYAANAVTDGIVCFTDTMDTVRWGWTGVETAVTSVFWMATPRGAVSYAWAGDGFTRRETAGAHSC